MRSRQRRSSFPLSERVRNEPARLDHARSSVGRRVAGTLAPALGLALVLSACSGLGQTSAGGASDGGAAGSDGDGTTTAGQEQSVDPALAAACADFWGDPDYADPLSRTVLDRAGTAPDVGPSDPMFYAMTVDDVATAFEAAPEDARAAATALADWFRTEPERGADADREAFRTAWEGVAGACEGASAAAAWALGPGEDGTKPSALVCADVLDTPSTLTHFANSNVLTSNMFKLVGLSARAIPQDRGEDLRATDELLAGEIAAADDDAVRAALEQVRAPFQDALDGATWSEGLQEPLTALTDACAALGYDASVADPGNGGTADAGSGGDGGEDSGGGIVGAPAAPDCRHDPSAPDPLTPDPLTPDPSNGAMA